MDRMIVRGIPNQGNLGAAQKQLGNDKRLAPRFRVLNHMMSRCHRRPAELFPLPDHLANGIGIPVAPYPIHCHRSDRGAPLGGFTSPFMVDIHCQAAEFLAAGYYGKIEVLGVVKFEGMGVRDNCADDDCGECRLY